MADILFRQLSDLKKFLQDAAEKEKTARAKLEKFIGELINRAERAESELRSVKSQSTTSFDRTGGLTSVEIHQVQDTICSQY